jgi:hypothetical protein
LLAACGSYNDSGAGNIFQISSWLDNLGTRNSVAVFGQGRAMGASSRAWGGNFVGYTGAAGAFSQSVEIDFGVANGISFQQAWALAINAGGTTGAPGVNNAVGINFDSLGAGGIYSRVIRFNNAGLAQPYQGSLIETGNAGGAITAPLGIDFSNAQFGTAAIKTKSFQVDPNGIITVGAVGGNSGTITFLGSTSGSNTLSVAASGGTLQTGPLSTGANGGTGGSLTLNGATSGSGSITVAAAGGFLTATPTFSTPFLASTGPLQLPAPVTLTAASVTLSTAQTSVIFNPAGAQTVTLPAASSAGGQWLWLKSVSANAVSSASSNIVPLGTTAAGTTIFTNPATSKWVSLQSDGVNWITMAGSAGQ